MSHAQPALALRSCLVSLNLSAFVLALISLFYSDLAAQEKDDGKVAVLEAIDQLRKQPQWQHLEAADAYRDQRFLRTGPELNAKLRIQSSDGRAITGALVVVLESAYDLFNQIYPVWTNGHRAEEFQSPLHIAATNSQGIVELLKVRRSRLGQPQSEGGINIARACALILHPDYGLTATYFKQSDELQEQTVIINPNQSYKGKIENSTEHTFAKAQLTLLQWSPIKGDFRDSQLCSFRDSPFSPRAFINDSGEFEWQGLPSFGWITATLMHPKLEFKIEPNAQVELNQLPLKLDADLKKTRMPIIRVRCVDEETGAPVVGCKVGEFVNWQVTDNDGVVQNRFLLKLLRSTFC